MEEKKLWAPWRMEFLKGDKPKGCVFCLLPKENNDPESLILYRGRKNFVILNKYPYNNGHLMVVPFEHTKDYPKLSKDVLHEMHELSQVSIQALEKAYGPQGYNLGMNLGLAAGAGIEEHLHIHIVPRWNGDTNFMPVIGETKCLPQHLKTSYDQIKSHFTQYGLK